MNRFLCVVHLVQMDSRIPDGSCPLSSIDGSVRGYLQGSTNIISNGVISWKPETGCVEVRRSPCGVDAIYYMLQAQRIVIASSLQALLDFCDTSPELEQLGLVDILVLGRILPPYTMYRDIRCVPPGHLAQFSFENRQPVVRLQNECDLASQISNQLDSSSAELEMQTSPSDDCELLFTYDADLDSPTTTINHKVVAPVAVEVFDAIPAAASLTWQPLGDLVESAFSAAIPELKTLQPLTTDLSQRLLEGLLAAPANEPTFDFLGTKTLRRVIQQWREQREPLLWQPVDRLTRRFEDSRINRRALFRLLHLLPERRHCLARIAMEHQLRLTFRCADTARLATRVVHKMKGANEQASASNAAQHSISLSGPRFPLQDQGYANPYQRAVMLSQQKCFGADDVNRFFHLQALPMVRYRKLRGQAIGSQLEQRLCSILSTQYLLNFSSPRAK